MIKLYGKSLILLEYVPYTAWQATKRYRKQNSEFSSLPAGSNVQQFFLVTEKTLFAIYAIGLGRKLKWVADHRYVQDKPMYTLNHIEEKNERYMNNPVKNITARRLPKHVTKESSSSDCWLGKWPWAIKSDNNWSFSVKVSINQAVVSSSEVGMSFVRIRRIWMWTSEGSTPNTLSDKVGHLCLYAMVMS